MCVQFDWLLCAPLAVSLGTDSDFPVNAPGLRHGHPIGINCCLTTGVWRPVPASLPALASLFTTACIPLLGWDWDSKTQSHPLPATSRRCIDPSRATNASLSDPSSLTGSIAIQYGG